MDQPISVVKPKPSKIQTGTEAIRVKKETKKKIQLLLLTVNKKDFGRKIKTDNFLAIATSLITQEHILKLQEDSFSNKDRLEMQFKTYQSSNAKVSKDEFIGLLLSGKIDLKKDHDSSLYTGKNSEDLIWIKDHQKFQISRLISCSLTIK